MQDLESQRANVNRIDGGEAPTQVRPNDMLGGLLGLVILTWLVLVWVPRLCLLVIDPAKLEKTPFQTSKWMLLLSIALVIVSLPLLKSTLAFLKEALIKTE
jgi:hypothetical protein